MNLILNVKMVSRTSHLSRRRNPRELHSTLCTEKSIAIFTIFQQMCMTLRRVLSTLLVRPGSRPSAIEVCIPERLAMDLAGPAICRSTALDLCRNQSTEITPWRLSTDWDLVRKTSLNRCRCSLATTLLSSCILSAYSQNHHRNIR